MADLKQALIWLAEGKKIRRKEWAKDYFRYIDSSRAIVDCDNNWMGAAQWKKTDDWELYEEPKSEIDPELINDGDYIVWDKNRHRTFAHWYSASNCFYPIESMNFCFALDVVEWKKLPERDKK